MADTDFFIQRPEITPTIYAYKLNGVATHENYIKIGYTERNVEVRIKEQLHTSGVSYTILLKSSAMRSDGSCFTDHDVHAILRRNGFHQLNETDDKNEWFNCSVNDIKAAIRELHTGEKTDANRVLDFKMRPEQYDAVQRTIEYFNKAKLEEPQHSPRYLWNAKMRFGKTFAAYELCRKMNFKNILVLTFKPAVETAWHEDLQVHINYRGWQFISNKDAHNNKINIDNAYHNADKTKPIVVFGSFQDLLGTNENGGIKTKNEFIHTTNWDIVIFDEYHYGAWRENAKKLFENHDDEKDVDFDMERYQLEEAGNAYNESFLPITTAHYLFLSGTPFRAINSGEFIEEQIYNWTYSDEQRAKNNWVGSNNPYLPLPRMIMMTYKIPESIRYIVQQGEFDEFDLNEFFSTKGKGNEAKFVYENEVQKWLDLIRGAYLPSSIDDLKLGQDKRPPMPYSDTRLLNILTHTLWFLPNVAACYAMYNLLHQKQNTFYWDYKINLCAGAKAGIGLDAVYPVINSMDNPLTSKTITLSCGKLTTGVTIKPWTGIFMLRNMKSPETYFQAAFRVQSPWTVQNENGDTEIIKKECYVFDFALDRALRQISDYSCRLNIEESNPEKKVGEFISFLPVLAYDGSTMKAIDAQDILDITMAGTSATLLARRWESALLVNVDNATLSRLINSKEALEALEHIEGFRNLNSDIETIINKSEAVKKAKKEKQNKLTDKEKKEISEAEKEYKSMRKKIQEKLIKFATRVPVFMYLTDYREKSLKDVITQLEPGLFKKVTGLNVFDFELLCSIGVFNVSLMNDAIFKFKRYEDASLSYTGIDKNKFDEVGGWDTVINRDEYEKLFYNQQIDVASKQTDNNKVTENNKNISQEKIHKIIKPAENNNSDTSKDSTIDYENITVGATVSHKKFGIGIIFKLNDRHVYVEFKVGQKTFIYPDAFTQGFLKTEKSNL